MPCSEGHPGGVVMPVSHKPEGAQTWLHIVTLTRLGDKNTRQLYRTFPPMNSNTFEGKSTIGVKLHRLAVMMVNYSQTAWGIHVQYKTSYFSSSSTFQLTSEMRFKQHHLISGGGGWALAKVNMSLKSS